MADQADLGYSPVGIMSISDDFKTFLSNIAVDNHATIETRYEEITGDPAWGANRWSD